MPAAARSASSKLSRALMATAEQRHRPRDGTALARPYRIAEVDGRRPGSQQVQRLFGAGAGFGGVGEEREPVVGGDVQPVEAEAQRADGGMLEVLDRGGVEADVVCG